MPEVKFAQAISFKQNGRNCWATTMKIEEVINLTLPQQGIQLDMFDTSNRGIDPKHTERITKYMDQEHWAIPPLILASYPDGVKTKPKGEISCPSDKIRVLDGQHRVIGIKTAAETEEQEHLKQETIAAVIIEVKNAQEQSRLWLDFAKNKPIEGYWKDAVDNHTPAIRIAKLAADGESQVLKGRTAVGRQALKHNSPEILTISELRRIVATIALGIQRQERPSNMAAYGEEAKERELTQKVARFFDEFLPKCKPNYEALEDPSRFSQNFMSLRGSSNAYDAPMLNLIADAYARWIDNKKDEDQLAEFIGKLNMSKSDQSNWLYRNGEAYNLEKEKYAKSREKKLWGNLSQKISEEASRETLAGEQ